MGSQFWFNGTSATSNTTSIWYPNIAAYQIPQLPSVIDKSNEYAFDRDAKLSPLEWLKRQVDDVCALAVIA